MEGLELLLVQLAYFIKLFSLQDFMNVKLGHLFLEASNMLLVFEQYCVQQAAATTLLEQLEREKELLRIFLQVHTTSDSLFSF